MIIKINPTQPEPELVMQAVQALKKGEVAIFPTDTVYGLGIAASNESDPLTLARIKERPLDKSIPLLIESLEAFDFYSADVPAYAKELALEHWPGALTLVVKASKEVPQSFVASDGSVALRVPKHPLTLELLNMLQAPLATSSANLSGERPARSVAELEEALIARVFLVLDGGKLSGTAASTVVSCLHDKPLVLREGPIRVRGNE